MDIKQIQELVKLINKTNIGEITIEEEGVKITVKQKKILFNILSPADNQANCMLPHHLPTSSRTLCYAACHSC